MSTVECKHLLKHFGRLNVVDDVSVEIGDGEFMVFVGPSGCGKSTTLRMIAGLESITSGDVYIDGKRINDVEPRHRDIAMVFQNYALYPHYRVYDNIAYALRLRRTPKAEIDKRVRETARMMRIEPLLDRWPRQLSGGERQRVALGRAVVRNPRLFLMDEPLSNLDAQLRVQMRQEIIRLQRNLGTTTVYVTHDQVEAMTMGDRIMAMRNGRIQQLGTPAALYTHPANVFVARFIGSPSMTLAPGSLAPDEHGVSLVTRFGRLRLPGETVARLDKIDAREVVWGIRTEHVRLRAPGDGPAGTIDLVESLGADAYVTINMGESTIAARVAADQQPREGERIGVDLDLRNVHLFDLTTEQRILRA